MRLVIIFKNGEVRQYNPNPKEGIYPLFDLDDKIFAAFDNKYKTIIDDRNINDIQKIEWWND